MNQSEVVPEDGIPDTDGISSEVVEDIDPIVGTRRDDILTGSELNDKLIGKKGNDILTGGIGRDKFKLGKGDDVITDFEVGIDRLLGKFKDAELSAVDGGTYVEYKKGSLLFEGLSIAEVETLL